MSQMNLMTQRRFAGMFWTQFLGAFNDNFFKNALIILVTFKGIHAAGISPAQMPAICGAIFILPFFLFSATAGQLADKLPKHKLVRWVKLAEIGIMVIAAFGFLTTNVVALLAVLFLMGLHSAFFGPVKYGILPQLLEDDALVGANGFMKVPVLNWICKRVRIIPIASSKEYPEILRIAFERIAEELDQGEIICIFPEGGLTKTGEMDIFRPGIEKILARNPVPVVPMALRGLWGGFFSRDKTKSPFRRVWSRIELAIGPQIGPEVATAAQLHTVVAELRGDMR